MTTAIGSYATTSALKALIGKTDTGDDTLLGLICDRVNSEIEGRTGRPICPIASATYTFDGDGSRTLRYPYGIRDVSLVQIRWFTQDSLLHTIPSTDYRVRPSANDRIPGWPGTRLEIVDIPLGGIGYWPIGYDTVSVTMTTGFDAIPDELTQVALNVAARAWNNRELGVQDAQGTDSQGLPIVARFFGKRDIEIINRYTPVDALV